MALTTCQDCGNTVSTNAVACPKCGAPVESTFSPSGRPTKEKITIEATSKSWKMVQAIGGGMTICGLLLWIIPAATSTGGIYSQNRVPMWIGIGITLFFWGLIVFLIGRIGAWWHHG